jgi:hypothetical protein
MTSRFSLVKTPILSPGHCWISKTAEGPFIDTGVDVGRMHIERGRIYLSLEVLREMARVAGILDEGKSASVELKEKEWYDKGYSDALKENYGDVLSRLADRVGPSILDAIDSAGASEAEADSQDAVGALKTDSRDAAGALKADENAGDFERKIASTGSRKRPARVSADSGDESAYRL